MYILTITGYSNQTNFVLLNNHSAEHFVAKSSANSETHLRIHPYGKGKKYKIMHLSLVAIFSVTYFYWGRFTAEVPKAHSRITGSLGIFGWQLGKF